jgi:hypothetical protein
LGEHGEDGFGVGFGEGFALVGCGLVGGVEGMEGVRQVDGFDAGSERLAKQIL